MKSPRRGRNDNRRTTQAAPTPRSLVLGRRADGRTVIEALQGAAHIPQADAIALLRGRHVRLDGKIVANPKQRVRPGQRLEVGEPKPPAPAPVRRAKAPVEKLPPIARAIRVRYQDEHILVVEKPAGLTTVRHAEEVAEQGARASRFLPPTLVDLLPRVLPPHERRGRIRAVHRLDRETSGLVVLARTPEAESRLGKQFRAHTSERRYLALVRGKIHDKRIESFLVRDRGDGRRGSGDSEGGQRAVTHIHVVEKLGAFTLVECHLETGRTHQVRIHLGEHGAPLCGERVYDRPLHGKPLPDESKAERPMLHAAFLAIDHPVTGKRMSWDSPLPEDMGALRRRLARTQ